LSGPYKVNVTIEKDKHGYYACCPELEGYQTSFKNHKGLTIKKDKLAFFIKS